VREKKRGRKDRNFIASLGRGFSILEAFDREHPRMGITDLSRKTGLSKSTVFRFVHTLSQLGYILPLSEENKYSLGPRVLNLGFSVLSGLELREIAQPYLLELSRQVKETVNLAILDGWELVYIERIKTQQIMNINLHVGSRLPLYNTAMGRVLSAFKKKEWIAQYINHLKKYPEAKEYWENNGLKLIKILEEVRKTGIALNNEELTPGLRSVAAPIRERGGEVVGAVNIAVSASLYSLQRLKRELVEPLRIKAQQISLALGFRV